MAIFKPTSKFTVTSRQVWRDDIFVELRRLDNVEMLSVTSCVERRRFLVLNFKPLIIFVSDKKLNWKIEESNLNQEQRGR